VNESRPGEPRCQCRDLEPMLAAYVDGEFDACDGDRVRAHVEACEPCRDRMVSERAAREAVRARRKELRPCAPDALKARCAAYAAQRAAEAGRARTAAPAANRPRPRITSLIVRWAPLSLAATVFLAVAVVFGFGLTDKAQALAFQSTIDHVKCSRFNAGSTHVEAADAARQWQSRFGWNIAVPASLSRSGLELKSVRRCGVIDGSVAHLMYSWMGEPLSVYVLPKRTLGDAAQFVQRFDHNSVMWSQNDRTYIIVTAHRRDPALDDVVAYVRSTAY
jgi:anti-sigma factor RsiW